MRATSNDAVRTVLAVLIFGLSLIFLIPPPTSDPGSSYTFFPGGAISVLLFFLSRFLDTSHGRLRVIGIVFETLLFLICGYVIYERVNMG